MALSTVGVGIALGRLTVGRGDVSRGAGLGRVLRLTSGLTVDGILAVAGGGLSVVLELVGHVVVRVVVWHDAGELLLGCLLLVEAGASLVALVLVRLLALVLGALLRRGLLLTLLRGRRLCLVVGSLSESVGALVVGAVELRETLGVETAVHGRVVLQTVLGLRLWLRL